MKTLYPLLLLTVVLSSSCNPPKEADTPSPAPINVPDTEMCPVMCEHFKALKCEEGDPLYNSDLPGPKGVPNQTCAEWCVEIQSKGTYLNPRCGKVVPSCDLIESWRKKTCELLVF